jgi:carbon monoxide dehydrogenase subunit G
MTHALRDEGLDFVDRAPVQVREEVVVTGATPADVWAALAEPTAWTEWFAGMKEARYTSPAPYGVATKRFVRVASMKANEEVLAFDVGARFAFRVVDANMPALRAMVEVVTLEAVDGGTRVVYRQAVELEPWARWLGPLARKQLSRSLKASLPKLTGWVADHPRQAGAGS